MRGSNPRAERRADSSFARGTIHAGVAKTVRRVSLKARCRKACGLESCRPHQVCRCSQWIERLRCTTQCHSGFVSPRRHPLFTAPSPNGKASLLHGDMTVFDPLRSYHFLRCPLCVLPRTSAEPRYEPCRREANCARNLHRRRSWSLATGGGIRAAPTFKRP